MDDRARRHNTLIELIEAEKLSNQTQVVSAMQDKGFDVTQPSISRDFKELGVVKLSGRYVLSNGLRPKPTVIPGSNFRLHTLLPAGPNLLVLKTEPGVANMIAIEIDKMELEGIVGTVAGDDTIFIATHSKAAQRRVRDRLQAVH